MYDPVDPTPSLAGPVGAQGQARVDNRMLEARPDVLTFTGAPLAGDLEVIGVPTVELHVGSDREHTDFFARLCEVEPAGRSVNICDGLLRLSPGEPPAAPDGSRRVRFEALAGRAPVPRQEPGDGFRYPAALIRGTRATVAPASRSRPRRRCCRRGSASITTRRTRRQSRCRCPADDASRSAGLVDPKMHAMCFQPGWLVTAPLASALTSWA